MRAPDFLTADGLETLLRAEWRVHFNSARTGVRLLGPRPDWARGDGGEAGLHPSNIHDTGYAIGAVDLTGDMPIILGPDGPSLGGFVCPAVVAAAERWKLGQLAPGDRVRLVPVDRRRGRRADAQRAAWLARATRPAEPLARPTWNRPVPRPARRDPTRCSRAASPTAPTPARRTAAPVTASCSWSTARWSSTWRCACGSTSSSAGSAITSPTSST